MASKRIIGSGTPNIHNKIPRPMMTPLAIELVGAASSTCATASIWFLTE
jgi:hypothetical protein